MAIEADGLRRRVERLQELAAKLDAEWLRASRDGGPLRWAEQQEYARGIREAADGLERAARVLGDALARIVHRRAG